MLKLDGTFVTQRAFFHLPKVWSKSYRSSNHTGRGNSDRKGIVSVSNKKGRLLSLDAVIKPRSRSNQYWRPPNPWVRPIAPLRG